ncbi:GNAT family N-acetyltransferase [Pseudomonas cavernae]|uniref:GNAT family N-acetyltransferase n=1 Tax=Pseudomonas cavernae TaxID=2320867 RepID=A0A385YZF7_9PSED|nr:GNAT family N-acetyltransferase [Pseudomonas cavernae]AYC32309.1 GNAT family N-acetyltransferase [Pseudomonas cavernae]
MPQADPASNLPDSPFASFSVRAACAADAPGLAKLLQQLGANDPCPDTPLLALRLAELPASREVLVAERQGHLLGTCTLNLIEHLAHDFARSAVLEDMVVDHQQRGLGIGQALIEKAAERARAWGCYKLALSTHQDRADAHQFYRAMGFQPHGISLALTLP